MVGLDIVPGEYDSLPDFLLAAIPGFQESPEFELVAEDTDLPGVIVGALSPYVVRLEGEASRETWDAGGRTSLDAVYETFERMASSRDGHVENALVVEVFEHLHCTERIRRRIVKQLGPHSRAGLRPPGRLSPRGSRERKGCGPVARARVRLRKCSVALVTDS